MSETLNSSDQFLFLNFKPEVHDDAGPELNCIDNMGELIRRRLESALETTYEVFQNYVHQ